MGGGEAETKGIFLIPYGLPCTALCSCALLRILPIPRSCVGKSRLGSQLRLLNYVLILFQCCKSGNNLASYITTPKTQNPQPERRESVLSHSYHQNALFSLRKFVFLHHFLGTNGKERTRRDFPLAAFIPIYFTGKEWTDAASGSQQLCGLSGLYLAAVHNFWGSVRDTDFIFHQLLGVLINRTGSEKHTCCFSKIYRLL